jgi:hypothetical protein
MTSKYSPILYIFFILLFLAGLAVLFLRQPFVDYWREEVGISEVEVVIKKLPPKNELINTDILTGDVLSSLSNQVTVFSWDNVCGDSLNAPRACVQGNSNPFLRK